MVDSLEVMLLQHDILWERKGENHVHVRTFIHNSVKETNKKIDVIALPELFATGFSYNPSLAEKENGPTCKLLSRIAIENNSYVIGTYLEEQNTEKPKNTAIVFNREGEKIAKYHKIHLFSPGFEDKAFNNGNEIVFFDIDGIKSSVAICYDLRFPELFRKVMKKEVDLVFVLANWPSQRQSTWDGFLKTRAEENQFYVCGVNRVSKDPHNIYEGGSTIIDYRGRHVKLQNGLSNPYKTWEKALIGTLSFWDLLEWRREFNVRDDARLI